MRLRSINENNAGYTVKPSQGDGWIIKTPYGYIDYRHDSDNKINEIWWVESNKKGHGSELVDLMQKHHPASAIAWGATSEAGAWLMRKWHNANQDIECITGTHDDQFDPFGNIEPDDGSALSIFCDPDLGEDQDTDEDEEPKIY